MTSTRQTRASLWTLAAGLLVPLGGLRAAETNVPVPLRLSLPLDYQVHQRASRSEGRIIVAGALNPSSEYPGTLEARLMGAGATADWQKLATLQSGKTAFRAELNGPAGGWYRLEVRVMQANAIAAEAAVEHVGVGEVFVIAGQSNAANHGEERQAITRRTIPVRRTSARRNRTCGDREWPSKVRTAIP